MTTAKMKHNWNESAWKRLSMRPHGQGTRRTDMYGFERYEDAQRDWYILSGENEAHHHLAHDTSREQRCTKALLILIRSA